MSAPKMGQSYYSWAISGAGFLTQLICVFGLATLGFVMVQFAEGINTTPEECAIISSVFGLAYGGFGVFWGWLADRIGIKFTVGIAGVGAGVSMIAFGMFVNSVPLAVFVYGLTGFFCAGLSSAIIPKLVSTWFHSSWMGKCLAVLTAGGTLAGFILGLLVPQLVLNWGWQGGFIGVGIVQVVLGIIIWIVVRNDARDYGIIPFGTPADEVEAALALLEDKDRVGTAEAANTGTIKEAARRPIVWKMGIIWLLYMAGMYADSTYQVTALQMFGWSLVIAGAVGSFYRLAQMFGAFFWSSLGDVIARKYVLLLMGVLSGAMFIVNGFVLKETGNPIFGDMTPFIFICFSALLYSFVPVLNAQASEVVEPEILGAASGLMLTVSLIGSLLGPICVSALVTAFGGDWGWSFWFAGICTIVCGIMCFIWLPKTGGKKYGNPFDKAAKKSEGEEAAA